MVYQQRVAVRSPSPRWPRNEWDERRRQTKKKEKGEGDRGMEGQHRTAQHWRPLKEGY